MSTATMEFADTTKKLGDQIMGLTLKEAKELSDYLKDVHGIEPAAGKKLTGLGGITTGEIMLRGVLQSRNSYIALISGPDGKTYSAHVNDRVLDGIIRSVTPEGIVIMQEVNDPLSLVKQREVRKGLRTAEDGK